MKKYILSAILAFTACLAQAAPVTWTDAVIGGNISVISTNGTSVCAYNFGLSGRKGKELNSVIFMPAGTDASKLAGEKDDITFVNSYKTDSKGGTLYNFASTKDEQKLSFIFREARLAHSKNSGGAEAITLNNLVIGQEYELQLFCYDYSNRYKIELNDAEYTSNNNCQNGTAIKGVFKADATTQSFSYVASDANAEAAINALQLRAIPEPATISIIGVISLGMCAIRRRFLA